MVVCLPGCRPSMLQEGRQAEWEGGIKMCFTNEDLNGSCVLLERVEGKPCSESHQGQICFPKSSSSRLPRKYDDIAVK